MKNKFSKFINLQGKYLTSLLFVLFFAVGQMWGAYYAPTADEVIVLPDIYNSSKTDAGYSDHSAITWGATGTTNSKKAGDPDNSGAATSANKTCYSVKNNSAGKRITLSISGCSGLIIYRQTDNLTRYVDLLATPDGESQTTISGSVCASPYFAHDYTLDGSKSYTIVLQGTQTGSDQQDVYVYAIKLIKATGGGGGGDPIPVTGITIAPSSSTIKVGKTVTLGATITPSNATDKAVTWAVTSGSTYASVDESGVVTGLAAGTAVVTATAHDGSGVTQTATITVEECPTYGTLFAMTVTDPDGTVYTDVTAAAPQEIGATYTGGKAYATSTSSSKRSPKITGSEFDFNVGSGGSVAVKVELDCPLAEGDIITFTSTHDKNFYIRKVVGTDLHTTSSLSFTIPSGSALIGEEVFYIMRTNSACSFSAINIVRPLYRTITLEYADGATADGSIEVIDGTAATKPADPTWAHHRFDGWYNGASPYDWTATVSGDLTLTAHWTQLYTVTYAAGDGTATGDAPTQVDKAEGETFEVAANTFAVAGKDFDKWNDGTTDYAPGDTYTVGTANVVLTAQWITATTKVTVTYKDGETTLGSEEITINTGNPVGYATYQTRNLATFDGWYNDPDLAEGHKIADISALTASANVNVYGKWNYQYASSANIEQWVLDNSTKYDAVAQLGTLHYASNIANSLDSLNDDPSKDNRNYAYLGLKIKSGGKMLDFRLANGQTVKVKFGATGNYPQVALNGGSYGAMSLTDNVWTYTADADAYISIKTANNNTVVIKQVMINEDLKAVTLPWRVTYDANGGTCGTTEAIWSGAALILPDVTPAVPADYTFAGWYDGDDLAGAAGANYTATKNVTLQAHFAPVEYAVNYSGGEGATGTMTAGAAGWGTMVTPDANAFEKTGHVFSGWEITKTSDGSATGITFSEGKFEMPKYDVTLVAQWEDVSKVAVVVETSAKYETLAAAIAAAEAGYTVQLIQDINQEEAILIAKNLTLDLNNKTFTVTNPSSEYSNRAIKVTAGTIVIENGTVDALSNETHNGGCWGSLRQEGGHLTCNHVTFKNYRSGGLGLKPVGGTLILNECTVLSEFGGGLELGNATVEVNNCTFTQTGTDAQKIYGACFGMGKMGTLTINGGTYTSDNYSFYIYTSGGTINVNSGTFAGDVKTEMNNTQYPSAVGTINISGGTFDGVGENPIVFTAVTANDHISISGGVFDAPIENQFCAYGYVPKDNGDGTYGVTPKDGVEIIRMDITAGSSAATVVGSGLYYKATPVNIDKSAKIKTAGQYIGFVLQDGKTFAAGDKLFVTTSTAADRGYIQYFASVDAETPLKATTYRNEAATGIDLPAEVAGLQEFYIKRTTSDGDGSWNPTITAAYVLRPMKPMLTAITIDGRDGVIDEDNKAVAVQIPYEANLASLTVVPTIAWNEAAATNSIVVNDGSAWIEGANTYKLTDKDGDYTVYTITLTRDVQKHTVSFNTHGGSAVASELVVHGEYLAAAPADPTKEDYIFQYWSEDEDGEAVNVTSFAITADKEFHAVWEAEPAGIKLFTDLGLNTTNFISAAKAEDSVVISEVKYPCLVNFASNRSSLAGAKQGDLVMYSATTDAAKIKFDLYNANGSAKTAYVWLVEEGDDAATQLDAIEIAGETRVKTAYYEFNGTKNRTVYLTSGSKADIKVLQAKVIESGNAIKQFGQAGYSLNLNHGRFAAATTAPVQFEGATITVSSEHAVLNSSNLATKAANSFNVTSPVIMHVERSGGKYYVYQDPADKGTLYSANADIELNATGTWYFSSENSGSAASFTLIRFDLPKCEKPTVADLANVDYCQGSAIDELAVSATVSDGGTKLYQWYKDGEIIAGADEATYQPTADGEYYVVVVNTLANHQNSDPTQSNTITVTGHAGTAISGTAGAEDWPNANVTISVTASGKNLSYAWYTCGDALGTNPVAVDPAVNAAELNVTVGAVDSYYKVVVSGDCGEAQEAVITVVARQTVALQDVTGNMTWDFSKANDGSAATSGMCNEAVLANVAGIINNDDFHSDNIMATANKFSGSKLQASMIKFHTTVDGMITVVFSNTDNKSSERYLTVNGRKTDKGSKTKTAVTYTGFVYAGDVELGVVEGDGNMLNFTSVDFKATVDYPRTVNPSYLGTLCWTNNAVLGGATLYEFAGKNEYNYLVFDEVPENRLEAGKPYIFMPENGNTEIKVYNTDNEDALTEDQAPVNHMYGTITGKTLVPGQDDNMYYFSASHIWAVKDFTVEITIPAYYCYVDYQAVLAGTPAAAPAPGRRRVTMGVQGEQVATGMEQITNDQLPIKVLINGQLFILRGEKMFNANGQLVK